jgi:hypothetical protein
MRSFAAGVDTPKSAAEINAYATAERFIPVSILREYGFAN